MIVYEVQLGPRQYGYFNESRTFAYIFIGLTHPNARKAFHSVTPRIRHKDYRFLG